MCKRSNNKKREYELCVRVKCREKIYIHTNERTNEWTYGETEKLKDIKFSVNIVCV